MKKILFPTDFSEVANNAFVHALEFAKIVKGELLLLHTFELPIVDNQFIPDNYYNVFDSLQLAQFDMFKEEIPKLRELARKRNLEDIKLTHKLMDGDLIYAIKQVVKDENIDFIVMGTSGATGWESFFVGSNTGSVVSAVGVPVLSVPFEAQYDKVKTIGFTTRFRDIDKKPLKNVIKIAKKTSAVVKCLYVKTSKSDVSEETINEWKTEFENEPVNFSIVNSDLVKETILDFISHKNIDILAMITHKRNFFSELFSPSLTQKIANISIVPVLAMHEEG
ncbi:universal stress protein [Flavobacterium gilvum]|uniref:Universal stress protein UspA n=1 Tax=Flavobacterium gilvum TaxID=1492737 RepID=A0AAC9N5N9_9FLAO|nr:universal stress protein [Flavobacterium gilvum]AOW10046.1 universal stress protein UspA [Flavobacterium gilvum]KFC58898.1 universal stress protein UspA [Flavobacterium gilvum]